MMTRTLLAACLLLGTATASFAAEESSNRGDIPTPDARGGQRRAPVQPSPQPAPQVRRDAVPAPGRPVPQQQPPQVYRQSPPPREVYREPQREVYREPPRTVYRQAPPIVIFGGSQPRYGYTCQTRRFECELRRPRPIGEECECLSPSGSYRSGEVVD